MHQVVPLENDGESKIRMCTLGMFIIDEIEYAGSQARQEAVIGGAGTYAAVGARMVAGRQNATSVGWILDMGSDFPMHMRQIVASWNTSCLFREDQGRRTTRAWNGYGPGDRRAFGYLTPKVRLDHSSLSEQLLGSDAFHLVCSPERCMSLAQGILERRGSIQEQVQENRLNSHPRPLLVWEPLPDLCIPQEVYRFRNAIQHVDIVSPNSEELAGLFEGIFDSEARMAAEVLAWGIGPGRKGRIVVREGKNGCTAHTQGQQVHLQAYHSPTECSQSRVVDPTGGGNAFLGALAMALTGHVCPRLEEVSQLLVLEPKTMLEPFVHLIVCLVYATIAASFVIEQPGMPSLGTADSNETWNEEGFDDRLKNYLNREKGYLRRQMTAEGQKAY